MRPRVLTIRAFGPYATEEVIDFRPLVGKDLLLVEGPIGAGKTAILDAMTFALYGVVPGARDEARGELKSAWADPSRKCEVRLEFELGERRYVAERAPAQTRQKKRGGGTTEDRAEARLWSVDPVDGRLVPLCPSKVGDVDGAVERLLGLTAEQFKQVLLLPQGEFRRFLLASSTDKEALLEKLFGTALYKQAIALLTDEKTRLERRVGDLERARLELLAGRGVPDAAAFDGWLVEARAHLDELGRAATAARADAAAARAAATSAEAQARAFAERARLAEAWRTLEARAPAIAALRGRLAAAERAAPVLPLRNAGERAARDVAARATTAAQLRAAAQAAAAEATAATEAARDVAPLRERAEALRLEELALAAVEALVRDVAAAQATLAARDEELRAAAARVAALDARIQGAEAELAALDARAAAAARAGVESARLAAEAQRADAVARDRAALAAIVAEQGRLARLTAQLLDERRLTTLRREAAARALAEARAAREAGLAAELAAGLRDGAPCPVCGGTEHPAPATGRRSPVDAPPLAAAEAALAAADRELFDLERRAGDVMATARSANERATELGAALGELAEQPPEALALAARGLAGQARAARAAADAAGGIAAARERAVAVSSELRAARAAANTTLASAESERAVAAARLDDLRARAAHGGAGAADTAATLASRRAAVARERATLAGRAATLEERATRGREAQASAALHAETATREAAAARARAAEAAEELEHGLRAAGLGDVVALAASALDDAGRAALRQELAAHDEARARTASRLETLEAELGDRAAPDAAALAAGAAAAEAQAGALATELGERRAGLADAERARTRLGVLDGDLAAAQAELARFAHVARVAAGENPLRMSLARFVLAQRIDEVAVAASERLLRLSRGRYVLRRSDEVRHAARGSGLDLVVEDRMTGAWRSVQTLSNGEQFLASLSLAMGLADTVQAHAGGVRLDSLFIDEGFGSLDDESLDLVVRTLEDLRAGGRLVGIITHVAELRERLTTRLTVQKGPRGSTTQLRV